MEEEVMVKGERGEEEEVEPALAVWPMVVPFAFLSPCLDHFLCLDRCPGRCLDHCLGHCLFLDRSPAHFPVHSPCLDLCRRRPHSLCFRLFHPVHYHQYFHHLCPSLAPDEGQQDGCSDASPRQ